MQAEHLDVDVEAKRAVLTGNVRLAKGTMSVAVPRVDVRYDEVPHVTWLKASGGVVAEVKGVRAEAPGRGARSRRADPGAARRREALPRGRLAHGRARHAFTSPRGRCR